jgi:succinyl-CoA synthetase beta subunit
MLGHRLRTKQTGDQGLTVERLYVVEKLQYKSEYYLAVTMDRESYSPAIVVSKAGGINIEDAAHNDPDAILKLPLKYDEGVTDEAIDRVAEALNLGVKPAAQLGDVLKRLYTLFVERDATLLEINPFVRTADGEFICLDSKFTFDDAAAPRQSELFALQAKDTTSQDEQEASKHGLVYVRLDGDIGNVVNGAGLAMATNDAISYYGGRSANFLDAGGQATTETMVKAFEIVLNDERVKVILVNIYGGMSSQILQYPFVTHFERIEV